MNIETQTSPKSVLFLLLLALSSSNSFVEAFSHRLPSSQFSGFDASTANTRLQVWSTRQQEAAVAAASLSSSEQPRQQQQWRENEVQLQLQYANNSNSDQQQQQKQHAGDHDDDPNMPVLGNDGVYHILNPEQHAALLKKFPDKLIIMKCFAPWCRACKVLEPKFLQLVHDEKYSKFPVIWADLSTTHDNKAFVKKLGVLSLPTIQFYIAGAISETFACGPSKFPLLKRKLAIMINENVDPSTYQLKASALAMAATLQRQQEEKELAANTEFAMKQFGHARENDGLILQLQP